MRTISFKKELFNQDKYGIQSTEAAHSKMTLHLHRWMIRQEMTETRIKINIETKQAIFF